MSENQKSTNPDFDYLDQQNLDYYYNKYLGNSDLENKRPGVHYSKKNSNNGDYYQNKASNYVMGNSRLNNHEKSVQKYQNAQNRSIQHSGEKEMNFYQKNASFELIQNEETGYTSGENKTMQKQSQQQSITNLQNLQQVELASRPRTMSQYQQMILSRQNSKPKATKKKRKKQSCSQQRQYENYVNNSIQDQKYQIEQEVEFLLKQNGLKDRSNIPLEKQQRDYYQQVQDTTLPLLNQKILRSESKNQFQNYKNKDDFMKSHNDYHYNQPVKLLKPKNKGSQSIKRNQRLLMDVYVQNSGSKNNENILRQTAQKMLMPKKSIQDGNKIQKVSSFHQTNAGKIAKIKRQYTTEEQSLLHFMNKNTSPQKRKSLKKDIGSSTSQLDKSREEVRNYTQNSPIKINSSTHNNDKQQIIQKNSIPNVITMKQNKDYNLSMEEESMYGNRFLDTYDKIELLGKGGFALVWKGQNKQSSKMVAIKQISRQNIGSANTEIRFIQKIQQIKQNQQQSKIQFDGIINCLQHIATQRDIWIIQELGGQSLSKSLYSIKGEFYKGERLYKVNFTDIYPKLFSGNLLKTLIRQLAQTLDMFQENNIMHCDIKPDNILVKYDEDSGDFSDVKLIDYGTFVDTQEYTGNLVNTTLEYMPPEVLQMTHNFSGYSGFKSQIQYYKSFNKTWSWDIWSLGSVIIEILSGIPHWMSYKCRVLDEKTNSSKIQSGMFAVKGQDYEKIIQRQKKFVENPLQSLKSELNKFEKFEDANQLYNLISQMMTISPQERISPARILKHPYLN